MPPITHVVRERETREFLARLERAHQSQPAAGDAYTGGTLTRANVRWQPPQMTGDTALRDAGHLLPARARDLARNHPFVSGAQARLARRITGRGIEAIAAVTVGDQDEPHAAHNRETDALLARYYDREFDAEGTLSIYQRQQQWCRELASVGEVLLLRCWDDDPSRLVPLSYQTIEAEQLDESRDAPENDQGIRTVRGIELDRRNRPVAYWLRDPADARWGWGLAGQSTRIEAARLIHVHDPQRPSETRSAGWFAASMQTAKDLDWFTSNELRKQYVQSLLTAVIKRGMHSSRGGLGLAATHESAAGQSLANPLETLGWATIAEIAADDDVELLESTARGGEMRAFVELVLLQLAAGAQGMSYVGYTGDYARTNYSSARAADNDDQVLVEQKQDLLGRVVSTIYREVKALLHVMGRFRREPVPAATFNRDPERWLAHTLSFPGRKQIDQTKETQAALLRIFGGLSTWEIELAALGRDRREVFRQLQQEWEELRAGGAAVDLNRMAIALAGAVAQPPANEQTSQRDGGEP